MPEDYHYSMVYKLGRRYASPISWPSWLDRRLVIVLALAGGLGVLGLCIAAPREISAFENGDYVASWQMLLALGVGAVVLGLSYGFVECDDR